jgi:hypothetical protein
VELAVTPEDRELLKEFQSEFNRLSEENFAQILTERNDIRLFFINENASFTDGRNIVLDPAMNELFVDNTALRRSEDILRLDHEISGNPWLALKMSTRALNVHESLHIIYSNFPSGIVYDERASTNLRKAILADISNIIEDAFIEAAGCSEFDNLEHLLLWYRLALSLTDFDGPDTVDRRFEDIIGRSERAPARQNESGAKEEKTEAPVEKEAAKSLEPIMSYLRYMGGLVLCPFYEQGEPPLPVAEYAEKTKQLFFDAAICGDADERYVYTQKIFDSIESLIPENDIDPEPIKKMMEKMLGGTKTHSGEASSPADYESKGKKAVVTRRLFTDKEGQPVKPDNLQNKVNKELIKFVIEKAAEDNQSLGGSTVYVQSSEYDCSAIHKNIKIEVNKPKINLNLKKAYQNLIGKYRLSINSYTSRFSQLLKGTADEREEKKYFGTGISSGHFADVKKRYWYRTVRGEAIPNVGFLILIDGSGSMGGKRQKGAIESSVVLHEVLKANKVEHAIVEHRALYGEPLLQHNILIGFKGRKEERYNILGLEADDGTREGLTLYWAERYLEKECTAETKIIIMISDGAPAHSCEEGSDYYPPVSIKDTALAAKKITRRGTGIIAIALEDEDGGGCYEQLKVMYSDVVSCTDISKLTGQLLTVITKVLKKL